MRPLSTKLLLVAALVLASLAIVGANTSAGPRLIPRLAGLGIDLHRDEVKHPRVSAKDQCGHCHQPRHRSALAGLCEDCHTTSSWSSAKHSHETTTMDQSTHAKLRCVLCHTDPNKLPKPDCRSCHSTRAHRWEPACERCHVVQSWAKTAFAAPKTHPRLAEKHDTLKCPDCHSVVAGKPFLSRCYECHKSHSSAVNRLGTHDKQPCTKCHTVTEQRDNLNKLAIKADQCVKCHKPRHGKSYDGCRKCHTEKFKGSPYDHSRNWPLKGRHQRVACAKCHPNLKWANTKGAQCRDCHQQRHTGLTDCKKCHSNNGFKPSTFVHADSWPLNGKHRTVACSKCHPGGDWGIAKGKTCVQCHGVQHGGLTSCAKCHGNESFKPSKFRHDSAWRKTGAHVTTACADCHPKKEYAWVRGTRCVQCHGVKHGGQLACDRCHRTYAWTPIKNVEHTPTYPLAGQHKYVDCVACHKNLRFKNTPSRCIDCHADLAHGHGHTQCEKCHTPRAWKRILPHDMSACQ